MRYIAVAVLVAVLSLALIAPQAAAQGLSKEQLGPPSWVVVGPVQNVRASDNQVIIQTDKGNLPLDISPTSKLRGANDQVLSLGDLKEGQRAVAAFHKTDSKNEVSYLYRPAKQEEGKGGLNPNAQTINADALGEAMPVIEGIVSDVNTKERRLSVTTSQGAQPLEMTGDSKVYGSDLQQTSFGNIPQGQRVLVSFRQSGGKNEVRNLFMLPG